MFNVSIYENSKDTTSKKVVPLDRFLRTSNYKDKILAYREKYNHWKATDGVVKNKPQKIGIPMITPSGTFSYRETSCLLEFNKIICIDIDGIENPEELKSKLAIYPEFYYIGLSASGYGLCAFVYLDCEADMFLDAFYKLEKWFMDKMGIEIDMARKDIVGARFASYDPLPHFNENPKPMSVPKYNPPEPKRYKTNVNLITKSTDEKVQDWVYWMDKDKDGFSYGQGYNFLTGKVFKAKEIGVPIEVVLETFLQLSDGKSSDRFIEYQVRKIYSK